MTPKDPWKGPTMEQLTAEAERKAKARAEGLVVIELSAQDSWIALTPSEVAARMNRLGAELQEARRQVRTLHAIIDRVGKLSWFDRLGTARRWRRVLDGINAF